MYAPPPFKQDDRDSLFALIEDHPFGTLAICGEGIPEIVHVPVLLDRDRGPHGRLLLHLARANPWWRAIDGARRAVAAFVGPSAYISPDWYGTGGHVPTWNYSVVHATGVPEILDDDALVALLRDISARHENGLAPKTPWTLDKLTDRQFEAMRRAIVGVSIPIATLEGKWKLGQNRKPAERSGAAEIMSASERPEARIVGRQMAALDG